MPKLKVELGKYYMTSDGQKVGPMLRRWPGYGLSNGEDIRDPRSWNANGIAIVGGVDLIAEWPVEDMSDYTPSWGELASGAYAKCEKWPAIDKILGDLVAHPTHYNAHPSGMMNAHEKIDYINSMLDRLPTKRFFVWVNIVSVAILALVAAACLWVQS